MAENVTIDLTNYKDKVGGRVTPGTYTVLVEDAEVGKASTGNTMITLWYRILGGEFDGTTVIDRLTQTEGALFRTVGFMQALGLPTPKKRLQINLAQFVGKRLNVELEDGDPYRGRVKSEVRGYAKAPKSSESDDVEDLPTEAPSAPETVPAKEASDAAAPASNVADNSADEVDLDSLNLG